MVTRGGDRLGSIDKLGIHGCPPAQAAETA
jgi:hypothetical protein